jgi:hypothetical protein
MLVDIAIHSSYQVFHESMEEAKYNRKFPPTPETISMLEEHEADLIPDANEDPVNAETLTTDEDITGIEAYQASVPAREVAREERQPLPALDDHPDSSSTTGISSKGSWPTSGSQTCVPGS